MLGFILKKPPDGGNGIATYLIINITDPNEGYSHIGTNVRLHI